VTPTSAWVRQLGGHTHCAQRVVLSWPPLTQALSTPYWIRDLVSPTYIREGRRVEEQNQILKWSCNNRVYTEQQEWQGMKCTGTQLTSPYLLQRQIRAAETICIWYQTLTKCTQRGCINQQAWLRPHHEPRSERLHTGLPVVYEYITCMPNSPIY